MSLVLLYINEKYGSLDIINLVVHSSVLMCIVLGSIVLEEYDMKIECKVALIWESSTRKK